MSFNDLENDAADAHSLHYKDFPEFEALSSRIESALHAANQQLSAFKALVSQFDANADGHIAISEAQEALTRSYQAINDDTKTLNGQLRKYEADHEDSDTVGYLKQKQALLINLVKSSLKQYQAAQRRYERLNRTTLDDVESHGQAGQNGQTGQTSGDQIQIQYESVNAEELEQQTLLVQEREREIEHISQDISYINDIYANLDDIVHEQQYAIDSIEDNLLRYNDDVQGAHVELRRAERYQRRSSGRMFCCLLILLGVMGFIILVGVLF